MLTLNDDQKRAFRAAVLEAAGSPRVASEIANLHRELAMEVAARNPRCSTSGDCCHFDRYGHLLFITTLEMAAFVAALGSLTISVPAMGRLRVLPAGGECPFQVNGLCSVHSIRPFGCRIYFCDPTAGEWQRRHYERFLGRLRRLHERMSVPYLYVEWRQALAAMGLTDPHAGVVAGESETRL